MASLTTPLSVLSRIRAASEKSSDSSLCALSLDIRSIRLESFEYSLKAFLTVSETDDIESAKLCHDLELSSLLHRDAFDRFL